MKNLVNIIEEKLNIKPRIRKYPNGMFCIYSSNIGDNYFEIFFEPYSNEKLMGSYISIIYLTNIYPKHFNIIKIDNHIVNIIPRYGYNNYIVRKKLNNIFNQYIKKYEENILRNIKEKARVFEIITSVRFPISYNYYNCLIKLIIDFYSNLNNEDFKKVFENCINVVMDLKDLIVGKNIPIDTLLARI